MDSAGAPRRGATPRHAQRSPRAALCVYLWRRRCQRRRRRRWHPKIPYYYIDYKNAAMRRAKNKTHRRAALLISPPSWQIRQFFFVSIRGESVRTIPRRDTTCLRVADRSSVRRATRAFSYFADAPYTRNVRLAIHAFSRHFSRRAGCYYARAPCFCTPRKIVRGYA